MSSKSEVFQPLPRPEVTFFGASSGVEGNNQLIRLVDLCASKHHYLMKVDLRKLYSSDGSTNVQVHADGEVIIGKQSDPDSTFVETTMVANKKRLQLCPSEPWGLTFHLPGPVDPSPPEYGFEVNGVLQIIVMKQESDEGAAASRLSAQ